jgi:uncharacterized protein (TIGR00251 family)
MGNAPARGSAGAVGLAITDRVGGVRFGVHVRPRSSRTAVGGVREGALEVSLSAPPVDGEANAELVKLLARVLDVRKADIAIVTGQTGRSKVVEVTGVSARDALERLEKVAR